MIKIMDRSEIPATLQSPEVANAKRELEEMASKGEKIGSRDFHPGFWQAEDVRTSLYDSQHSKCCYCENKRARKREFDAEHFRPKAGVYGIDHPGYWWLAYEWSNLLYSCEPCNRDFKRNQFPISGNRSNGSGDPLEAENPLLLDPIEDNPEDSISFDWQSAWGNLVIATGLDDRGITTIKTVGLNRLGLPEERAEDLFVLKDTATAMLLAQERDKPNKINTVSEKIRYLTSSRRRFASFRRAFFRGQGLGEYVSKD